jgi:hypothetical protein
MISNYLILSQNKNQVLLIQNDEQKNLTLFNKKLVYLGAFWLLKG